MYGFIFGLRVLDSNPAKTAPVCAIAIDVALVNYFFYQLCMFREQFFPYFMVPNFLSQISVILLAIAIFSILINLQFGIEGIIKRNIINSNRMTDLIHCISIINGILGILFSFTYMNILRVNIVEFIVGTVLAIGLIVLFNFVLRKLGVNNYPIEALSRYKYGRVLTKKDKAKEEEKLVSSS
jgi:hypothetical protein